MSKDKIYKTTSSQETQEAGAMLVKDFLFVKRRGAFVLALTGELGAGKTHLAQGVAGALGITRQITSPTFVIMKRYDVVDGGKGLGIKNFYHFDAYRLNSPKELKELGWADIVGDRANLIIVEWAEKVRGIIPKDAVWVEFKTHSENERELRVKINS